MQRQTYDHPPQFVDGASTCDACQSTRMRRSSREWMECLACGARYAMTPDAADTVHQWQTAAPEPVTRDLLPTPDPAPAAAPAAAPVLTPKRGSWLAGAVVVAIALGLVGYFTTRPSQPDAPTNTPGAGLELSVAPDVPATHTVAYTVTVQNGMQQMASTITYTTPSGQSQATDQAMPWSYTDDFDGDAFLYVSAQNAGDGDISCTIEVDGQAVSSNTATGQYAIVTCKS